MFGRVGFGRVRGAIPTANLAKNFYLLALPCAHHVFNNFTCLLYFIGSKVIAFQAAYTFFEASLSRRLSDS